MTSSKPASTKKASSRDLIDVLVEKEVKSLRVTSKLKAGDKGGGEPPRCHKQYQG
jgi:hypothetical protein